MHSFLNRVQQTSGTFSTIVAVGSLVIAVLAVAQLYFQGAFSISATLPSIEPSLSLRTTRRFGAVGKPKENTRVKFDLDADLSPLFNWNTKQVFVYLTADYGGKRDDISNVVTFWDKIITSPEDAVLHLKNERGKYSVWDTTDSFDGRNATIHLRWNVQPHVGFLVHGEAPTRDKGRQWFVFPDVPEEKPKKA